MLSALAGGRRIAVCVRLRVAGGGSGGGSGLGNGARSAQGVLTLGGNRVVLDSVTLSPARDGSSSISNSDLPEVFPSHFLLTFSSPTGDSG